MIKLQTFLLVEAAVLFQSQIPILNPGVAAQGWAGSASSWAISQWKAKDILDYVDLLRLSQLCQGENGN